MKTAIIIADVHLDDKGPTSEYKLVKKYIKENNPDEIHLIGDFWDVASLSHWDLCKKRKMEGKRFTKEVKVVNDELDYLQKYCKSITYYIGNHEDWINKYLDDNPEMEGMIDLDIVLRLKERRIKLIKYNDLNKVGHIYLTHGMYTGVNHSKQHLLKLGCSIIYGHIHDTQSYMMNMAMMKPHISVSIPCLCGHKPDYMDNKPANWLSGFGILEYSDNGDFNIYPVIITNNKFRYGGKEYKEI